MINYVKRAYVHARATRDVYAELPDEDKLPGEGDLVGKLDLCLYAAKVQAREDEDSKSRALQPIRQLGRKLHSTARVSLA